MQLPERRLLVSGVLQPKPVVSLRGLDVQRRKLNCGLLGTAPINPLANLFSGKQAFVLAAGLRLHVRNRTGLPVTGQMLFIPVLTRPLDS